MNYDLIKSAVAAVIKENGNEEITGNILQQALLATIDVLGLGYQYMGIATPSTNPGTPDAKVFYIAQAAGTYSNFNDGASSPVLDGTAIGLFAFDTQWHNTILDVATKTSVEAIVTAIDEELNDKIDKVADATPGNLPQFGNDGALTDSDILSSDVATKQELAVATLPGVAEAVLDTDNAGTKQQITFRKSGGDGGAFYRKILGRSLAFNQLITPSPQIGAITTGTVTLTANGDGTFTLNGTAVDGDYFIISCGKLGVKAYLSTGTDDATITAGDGYTQTPGSSIVATTQTGATYIGVTGGVTYNNVVLRLQYVDLTQEFGAGYEPATAAEFEALYPDPLPYNPGTLKSNDAEAVETTGANQFDEETEVVGSQLRSKNLIPVFPNTAYYITMLSYPSHYHNKIFYNAEGEEIGLDSSDAQSFTTPADCAYMRFVLNLGYGTTYNHDICINLSNPAINGQYFPYWKRDLQLNITTRKDTDGNVPFADGMKGAGTAADWADKVGGEKRMKRVDLGSLEWNINPNGTGTYYAVPGGMLEGGVLVCSKYVANNVNPSVLGDKEITSLSTVISGNIDIKDSAFAGYTGAQVAAALSGVMLDFELATPVPFTWAEPLNLGVKVDENGTERAVAPEGATEPSAPFVAMTTYTMSIQRMVQKLAAL